MSKLSVIVPVYNAERYLADCIESILSQTFTDLELILVNDGSTDGSGAICDRYARQDSRVKVIHQENQGVTEARKKGFGAASGEFTAFVDSDDYIDPTMYEQLMDQVLRNHADYVACDIVIESDSGRQLICNQVAPGIYDRTRLDSEVLPIMLMVPSAHTPGILASLCPKVIRRDLLIDVMHSIHGISYGEDAMCSYSALLRAERLCVLHEAPYHYRQVSESATHQFSSRRLDALLLLFREQKAMLSSSGLNIMDQLSFFISLHSLETIRKLFLFDSVSSRTDKIRYVKDFAVKDEIRNSFRKVKANLSRSDRLKVHLLLGNHWHLLYALFSFKHMLRKVLKGS